jgi:hypothetical protein
MPPATVWCCHRCIISQISQIGINLDFFATPVPGFEEAALVVIADGLETDGNPRQLRRAARLLQAYELAFWDSVAGN